MWINGDAFRVVSSEDLVYRGIYDFLPNKKYVNKSNATLFEDFTLPTHGDEVPWGTAQLTFFYRSDIVEPFNSYNDLLNVIKKYTGQLTYPAPPDFTGFTFVKSLFYVFSDENKRDVYYNPYEDTDEEKQLIKENKV